MAVRGSASSVSKIREDVVGLDHDGLAARRYGDVADLFFSAASNTGAALAAFSGSPS